MTNVKRKSNVNIVSPIGPPEPLVDNEEMCPYEKDSLEVRLALSSKINALRNLQLNIVGIEEKFYEELHQLECKYSKLYAPLFEKRKKLITGEYEPTSDESTWAFLNSSDEAKNDSGTGNEVKDLIKDMESKIDLSDFEKNEFIGVPHFWLQAFKRTDLIMDMIQEHDEEVLINLINIKAIMNETKPYGYTLEFHFQENEFFTNKVLTKSYELTCEKDEKAPFFYDGPVIYKCKGCTIDWNKGKDVTMRTVKKRQKHKSTGTVRVIMKEEKQDSFFNFFDTPTSDGLRPSFRKIMNPDAPDPEDEDEDEIAEDLCNADFEIGHFFKEFMIPRAVLYYTGEATDEASYTEDDELEDFFQDKENSGDDELDYEDEEDDEEAKERESKSPKKH